MLKRRFIYRIYSENSKLNDSAGKMTAKKKTDLLSYSQENLKNTETQENIVILFVRDMCIRRVVNISFYQTLETGRTFLSNVFPSFHLDMKGVGDKEI